MARNKTKHPAVAPISQDSRPTLRVLTPPSRDELIAQIRNDFVSASVGVFPILQELMRKRGLLDDGVPTTDLTEDEVREVAAKENWKWQREQRLQSSNDLIPVEVRMTTFTRGVELRRMLARMNDLNYRAVNQYHREGRATTLDGTREIACPKPEAVMMGAMAEQRVTESLLENLQSNEAMFTSQEPPISPLVIQNILRLKNMTPDEVEQETRQLNQLTKVLTEKREPLTMEQIESQEMTWESEESSERAITPKRGKKVRHEGGGNQK